MPAGNQSLHEISCNSKDRAEQILMLYIRGVPILAFLSCLAVSILVLVSWCMCVYISVRYVRKNGIVET